MSSGLIPLEDFEHAIAHLSFIPTLPIQSKEAQQRGLLEEIGQNVKRQHTVRLEQEQEQELAIIPTLPLEIIYLIACHLFDSSHLSAPSWLLTLQSPTLQDPSNQSSMHGHFRALLCLSSACKSYRSLLAPLIWQSVYFHHPRHFGEFVELMRKYRSISAPITSSFSGSNAIHEWKQEYPLRLVKELHLVMPQKYPGFNQGLLVNLLRDGMNHSLRHVVWEAEELPAASTLKAMVIEDYYVPNKQISSPSLGTAVQPQYGLASEIEEEDIVRWTRASRDGEAFPAKGHLLPPRRKVREKRELDRGGLSSLSVNCKCFWPGHASLSLFTTIQHLRFTYYDLFLLPPHLAAMLQNLHYPLLSLSMSTSKTSLFHSIPIINSGCFDNLQILDLYPVTPEYPLPQAIRRCRKSLRVLRLVMDISANFANFDNLWKILMGEESSSNNEEDVINAKDDSTRGSMEALEMLHIDPMPQQNTAPSFVKFVEACPNLKWVNGRRSDSFAPGMEPINPDDITSAMYF